MGRLRLSATERQVPPVSFLTSLYFGPMVLEVRTMYHPLKGAHRAASTLASGRAQLLQKKHDDIVITFAKRTAMGRARKGQLKDVPVDELLFRLFKV